MVFYAQSTGTVMSGRERERERWSKFLVKFRPPFCLDHAIDLL